MERAENCPFHIRYLMPYHLIYIRAAILSIVIIILGFCIISIYHKVGGIIPVINLAAIEQSKHYICVLASLITHPCITYNEHTVIGVDRHSSSIVE